MWLEFFPTLSPTISTFSPCLKKTFIPEKVTLWLRSVIAAIDKRLAPGKFRYVEDSLDGGVTLITMNVCTNVYVIISVDSQCGSAYVVYHPRSLWDTSKVVHE